MRLTEEDMRVRREAMIEAAFHMYCERGIENVTLFEISRDAKVGETTVYRYFENKTSLVTAVFHRLWDVIDQHLNEIVKCPNYQAQTGLEQVDALLGDLRQLYLRHSDYLLFYYEAAFYFMRHRVSIDRGWQNRMLRAVCTPFVAALDQGKADGSIKLRQNSETIFFSLLGYIRGFILKLLLYDGLSGDNRPWEIKYNMMKRGILDALGSGRELPEYF